MNNLIINSQFIGSQQTHSKRRLHRIELQEHRGEHCIEDQRERRSHLATSYGPVGLVNYSHIIGRVARLMKKPSMIDSPFDRVPEKASRWDRGRTEACDSGKVFSSVFLVYGEYFGIYSAGIRSRGATRGPQAWGRTSRACRSLVALLVFS
jgi:hypothetical protein